MHLGGLRFPEPEANSRLMGAGFDAAQVATLIWDPRMSEGRRVLYGIDELMTGLRTGEVAARTRADYEPAFLGRLGRLTAASARIHRLDAERL